jgi:dipeptidyl aminopeptidase/acylaminoacyl peptidase
MKKQLISILFYLLVFSLQAQTVTNLIKVTDLLQVKNLGAVTFSPSGKQVAFTVTSIEQDPKENSEHRYISQIYLMDVIRNNPIRQLTYAADGALQPMWSPDEKSIAFVRPVEGKPQIFILTMSGGESLQVTNFKYGASNPVWSPDSKKIVFTSGINLKELLTDSLLNPNKDIPKWSYEKPGFFQNEHLKVSPSKADPDGNIDQVRAYLDNNEKDNKAKVINQLHFQEEASVSSKINFSHLFLVDADKETSPVDLTPGFSSCTNPVFTPDGKTILFEGDLSDEEHPNRSLERSIFSIGTDGKNLQKVLGEKGVSFTNPTLSLSGKWLAFQYDTPMKVSFPKMAFMPLGAGKDKMVTVPVDRNQTRFIWSESEKFLYFTTPSNGGIVLSRVQVKNNKVERLTHFDSGISSFDISNNRLAYVKTEVKNPFELYLADATAKNPLQVSTFNTEWLKDKKLSIPEKKTFTNSKGQQVEYWVMKPTNFESGKKYPLLLEIHGGPTAMWGPGESSMWHEFQYFCAKGYGVVYANPRGSGGYGKEFMSSNIKDWGSGPAGDVLAALDGAVAEGWADTARLAISGGSYGGYLVSWILGHDKRFKAACAQRGVYDLRTFFGEGNAWRLVPMYFGGFPWEEASKDIVEKESPLSYVQNITTPLIIFHGENDLRTGVIQSEMLYKSLKLIGSPVEYVRHPGATHEITRSGNNRQRIDQMLRTYEFFERWLHPKGL